jgi:UDP-N-acetylmuramoyl-tripeptide--D-alanyl-D-alanine ligase
LQFGLHEKADVSGSYQSTQFGSKLQVRLRAQGATRQFSLQLAAAGEHNVKNALAAIACCYAAGIEINAIVEGLEKFSPVSGRLQRKLSRAGAMLIDDTYNANPDSVRAAIEVLASAADSKILVLGDMGEVGENGPAFHAEIGSYAASRGVDYLFCLGEASSACVNAWRSHLALSSRATQGTHFTQLADLLAAIDGLPAAHQASSTILVKGSRYMQMERVVQHLLGQTNTQGAH